MNNLIKRVTKETVALGTTKDKIKKILDFLNKNSYIEEQALELAAYGRFLKNLGQAIEDHASKESIKYLEKNDMNMDVSDMNISYREYFDKVYPEDKQLEKYDEKLKEIDKERKEIKQSIKNRKKRLEEQGQVLKILKNKSLSIRNK